MNIPAEPSGAQRSVWGATVGTAIAIQWLVILVLAGAAGIWAGDTAAVSLLMGGAAVAIPNAVLALWLTLRLQRTSTLGVVALFMGELLKMGFTIGLLVAIVVHAKPSWIALIVGLVAALKAQWLALWFTRQY